MTHKSVRTILLASVFIFPTAALANPLLLLVPAGHVMMSAGHWILGHLGHAGAVAGPATPAISASIGMTTHIFTSAATGATLLTVKTVSSSFIITKAGVAALAIAAGTAGVAGAEYLAPTKDAFKGLDYVMPADKGHTSLVEENIKANAEKHATYKIRYCLLPDGKKEILPQEFIVCPRDASQPKEGESINYLPG